MLQLTLERSLSEQVIFELFVLQQAVQFGYAHNSFAEIRAPECVVKGVENQIANLDAVMEYLGHKMKKCMLCLFH